jgi:hypothetical protein
MRALRLFLTLILCVPIHAEDVCEMIHGRAHLYGGDGQLRIWHIGTHHEYKPDKSTWPLVEKWLEAGVKESDRDKYASPASMVNLYADFLICPTEPHKNGVVQRAKIKRALHRRYVTAE